MIGIVTFVQRQRKRRRFRPRPISNDSDSMDDGPQMMVVTPFNLNSSGATLDPGISAELPPEQQLLIRDSRAVGLSDKEIARLRAEALNSPQPRVSASNISQPTSPPNAITESGESPYDTRRLHSEFETLRREVERLRADGLVVTAPPSYAEGDG